MSTIENDQTPNTPESLRLAYETQKAERAVEQEELTKLRRERLFLQAGINPEDDGPGQLLFEVWTDGSLDELKARALKVGALKPPSTDQVPEPGSLPNGAVQQTTTDPSANREQQELGEMARGGQSHGGTEVTTPHPMTAALEGYQTDLKAGMETEEARAKLVGTYMTAAIKGDPRTRHDPQAHRDAALEAEKR